jgi:hypothetical protein
LNKFFKDFKQKDKLESDLFEFRKKKNKDKNGSYSGSGGILTSNLGYFNYSKVEKQKNETDRSDYSFSKFKNGTLIYFN